ncbi:MAG: hypothetical protein H6729_17805 [Deltaproteobacteria bacterium]|nr:hypothetical protein [Deltaproteobacteria bacterium]
MNRWKGLKDLLHEAIDKGSTAIEDVHTEIARRPFDVLEKVPPLRRPTQLVRVVHDIVVHGGYGAVRLANDVANAAAAKLIDTVGPACTMEPGGMTEPGGTTAPADTTEPADATEAFASPDSTPQSG